VRVLRSLSFVYDLREDRILAAINAGTPDVWSCWLTRRITLALLARVREILAHTSSLAQQTPAAARDQVMAFERDTALLQTESRMTQIPPNVIADSATVGELIERLSIGRQGDGFRVELQGLKGGAAAGVLRRIGLQRISQMLQDEVVKAGWMDTPTQHLIESDRQVVSH
jgi:hypothetical protein